MQTRFNARTMRPPPWPRSILISLAVLAFTCTLITVPLAAETAAAGSADRSATRLDPGVMRQWSRSCALCHVDGTGGAPRIGRADEWQPRLAKGRDVLLQHTVKGFNNMPPLGYCMSCEAEDFRALIDFMAGAAP